MIILYIWFNLRMKHVSELKWLVELFFNYFCSVFNHLWQNNRLVEKQKLWIHSSVRINGGREITLVHEIVSLADDGYIFPCQWKLFSFLLLISTKTPCVVVIIAYGLLVQVHQMACAGTVCFNCGTVLDPYMSASDALRWLCFNRSMATLHQ